MEKEPISSGMRFVLDSFAAARKRLALMKIESRLRDLDDIWEAYCDIEQSIEVSKFLFKLHNRLGRHRKLVASARNDPAVIPLTTLAKIYVKVDVFVASADKATREGRGGDAIEFARSARDQLKLLLLGQAKSEQTDSKRNRSARV